VTTPPSKGLVVELYLIYFGLAQSFVDAGMLAAACDIASSGDSETCKDVCEASRCCFDADSVTNCYSFADNYEACDAYRQSCSFLGPQFGGHPKFLKDPPNNLADLCSANTQNRDACQLACGTAVCCFDDGGPGETGSCFEELREQCAKYEACETLIAGDSGSISNSFFVEDPPSDLAELCSVDTQNRDACELACDSAACCFGDEAGETGPCFEEHRDSCDMYEACETLVPGDGDSGDNLSLLDDPPSDLAELCSVDTQNRRACELACDAAACCFGDSSGEAGSCFGDFREQCAKYEACDTLMPGDGAATVDDTDTGAGSSMISFPAAVANLDEICDPATLTADDEQRDECEELCSEASCCFLDPDDTGFCGDTYYDECDTYEPCNELLRQPIYVMSPPADLDAKCSSGMMGNKKDKDYCEGFCSPALQCCTNADDPTINCYLETEDTCSEYDPCMNIDGVPVMDQDGDGGDVVDYEGQVISTDLQLPPGNLDAKCSSGMLGITKDKIYCENFCRPALECCHNADDDPTRSCYLENEDACLQYAPCSAIDDTYSVMVDQDQEGGDVGNVKLPPDDLAKTCNELYMLQSDGDGDVSKLKNTCQEVCDDAHCCVSGNPTQNCFEEHEDVCVQYQPCSSIIPEFATMMGSQTAFVPPESPPNTLYSLCLSDKKDIAACEGLCEKAACCVSSHAESNCFAEYTNICMAYTTCQSIFDAFKSMGSPLSDTDSSTTPPSQDVLQAPTENLEVICSQDVISYDKDPCVNLCKVAYCCFPEDTGAKPCLEDDMCENYSPCGNVTPYG
jgi:hypothetical protein